MGCRLWFALCLLAAAVQAKDAGDAHLPVARYYTPAEFSELRDLGLAMGFTHVQSSPLTRSEGWSIAVTISTGM